MILVKPGVKFVYSPGGLAILNALKTCSKLLNKDLTITSGCDGVHFDGNPDYFNKNLPNPNDPHYLGNAYDVRSHDLSEVEKQQVLANLNNLLNREHFYYYLEDPNTAIEHFHIQVKKNTVFGIEDFLAI